MKKPKKLRLDQLLVERGLFDSKNRAQAAVMEGKVRVGGMPVTKAGQAVAADAEVEIAGPDCPYVSRGGLKLEKALKEFKVEVKDKVCLDVGASTGGFTDCLLQRGAKRVFAVDVGYGQLDYKLRGDARVDVREKVNARGLEPAMFEPGPELAVFDVSFISLTKVLGPAADCLPRGASLVALIKPQFELQAKDLVKGIVRDEGRRRAAVSALRAWAKDNGFKDRGVIESPITGTHGNTEFLWHLEKT